MTLNKNCEKCTGLIYVDLTLCTKIISLFPKSKRHNLLELWACGRIFGIIICYFFLRDIYLY